MPLLCGSCANSQLLTSRKFRHGVPYPRDVDEKLRVPDTFYMLLDMDRGTLAFQVPSCDLYPHIILCLDFLILTR